MAQPPEIKVTDPLGRVTTVPPISQAEINTFYAATGYAINQWTHIDRLVFKCFRVVLGCEEKQAAVLYYRQKEFGSRLSLTDDLLASSLELSALAKWSNIKGRLNTRIRNLLAHQPIEITATITNVSHLTPDDPIKFEHAIRTQFDEAELMAGKEKKQVFITRSELEKYIKDMQTWETLLREFIEELESRSRSDEKEIE